MIRTLLFGILFGLVEWGGRRQPTGVMIHPQYAPLEPDIQQLLRRLPGRVDDDVPLYLCTANDTTTLSESSSVDESRITTVKPDTLSFLSALRDSRVVVLKGNHHLHAYRFFGRNIDREFVLFYHGIITKAYGKHTEDDKAKSIVSRAKSAFKNYYLSADLSVRVVGSEIERFFRSSAEGRHPKQYEELGYPRFDRISELLNGGSEPAVDDAFRSTVESSTVILYAPTHKDGVYNTSLFPFDEFDADQLVRFLQENNCTLLLRMHPNEEDAGVYDTLVDGEHIVYAGQDVTNSPVELFPFVDMLITDYSSIYIDFLPFDRPAIFVPDRHDQFEAVRGIAFDYDRYFPGNRIEEFSDFVGHLTEIIENNGDDGYSDERAFVRTVLIPDWAESSISSIIDRFDLPVEN